MNVATPYWLPGSYRYLKDLRTYFDGNDALVLRQYTCACLCCAWGRQLAMGPRETENSTAR